MGGDSPLGAKLGLWIIIGTIPAAIVGVLFEEQLERLFSSVTAVGWMWLFTGTFLFATRFVKTYRIDLIDAGTREGDAGRRPSDDAQNKMEPGTRKRSQAPFWASISGGGRRQDPSGGIYEIDSSNITAERMTVFQSVLVGFAQAVAIIPGVSRSGATIVAGLFLKLDRELAARFSFLLAIPAILGGMVLKYKVFYQFKVEELGATLIGTITAAVVGYIALRFLLGVVKKGKLFYFAFYCWAAGAIVVIASLVL